MPGSGVGKSDAQGGGRTEHVHGKGSNDKLPSRSAMGRLNGGKGDRNVVTKTGNAFGGGRDSADDRTVRTDSDKRLSERLYASDLNPEHLIILRDSGKGAALPIGASEGGITARYSNNTSPTRAGRTPTEAVLVTEHDAPNEALAVLYDNGADAPEITVTEGHAGVYTVLADGVPVAVVASADDAVTAADVLLVERNPDGTAPIMAEGAPIQ